MVASNRMQVMRCAGAEWVAVPRILRENTSSYLHNYRYPRSRQGKIPEGSGHTTRRVRRLGRETHRKHTEVLTVVRNQAEGTVSFPGTCPVQIGRHNKSSKLKGIRF